MLRSDSGQKAPRVVESLPPSAASLACSLWSPVGGVLLENTTQTPLWKRGGGAGVPFASPGGKQRLSLSWNPEIMTSSA